MGPIPKGGICGYYDVEKYGCPSACGKLVLNVFHAPHTRHNVAMTYFFCSESLAALVAEQLACEIPSL
jgi:hypothetical protein